MSSSKYRDVPQITTDGEDKIPIRKLNKEMWRGAIMMVSVMHTRIRKQRKKLDHTQHLL